MRDQTFGWEMRTWARAQTATGKSKVYLYFFSHVPPIANHDRVGAQHGAEIPYALNWPSGKYSGSVAWQDMDRKLAEQVSSYWTHFAATGDPNTNELPAWPPYRMRDDLLLEFGDRVAVAPVPHKSALDFFDRYFDRLRKTTRGRQTSGG
jgi:para-nitrobenzyl esterase